MATDRYSPRSSFGDHFIEEDFMKANFRPLARGLMILALSAPITGNLAHAGQPEALAIQKPDTVPSTMTSADRAAALVDKAQREGKVRVIAKLKSPATPEATLTPNQITEQRQALQGVQDRVLGVLVSQGKVKEAKVRRFEITPAMALEATPGDLALLAQNPEVEEVVEDSVSYPTLYQSTPLIGATDAWAAGFAGSGYTVAILDSGVYKTHPFLTGKVVSEACYSTTTSGSGWSATSLCPGGAASSTAVNSGLNCNTSSWGIGCSHGTHVAGIAAGKNGASTGGTMSGVAKEANVIAIQVFSGYTEGAIKTILSWSSDQISAMERVYSLRSTYNIAAVNMSLGGGKYTSTCDTDPRKPIIDNLRAVGIATVISSGNEYFTDATGAPGCISTAITVGSSTKADVKADYSNMASWVDLFGPGSDICSSIVNVGSSCGTGYAAWGGTSMAAPQATGAWAVMKSKKSTATVSEIESALETTGVPISTTLGNWPRIALVPALAKLVSSGGTGVVTGLSAQGKVGINNEQLFGTFTISSDSRTVLIRGLGPTLADYGTPGTIPNPQIKLTPNGSITVIAENDDWKKAANAAEIQRLGYNPKYDTESAILITLQPGVYNIYMSPSPDTSTGAGMLSVYPK